FSSRRRHTRFSRDWSSDVCSSDLIATRGSHNYAIQIDDCLTTTGKQAVAAPHFFVVRSKENEILPAFLAWLLNQTPNQRYFEQNAEGTLSKSIRRNVVEHAQIVIPPL